MSTEHTLEALRHKVGQLYLGRYDSEDIQEEYRLDLDYLLGEVDRLRAGRFTEQEFQALCHNLPCTMGPGCRERFEEGCRRYQDQLFGRSRDQV